MGIPHAVDHIPQDQDVSAQVEPHQKNDHRGQGPVDQGVAGGHADKPGKERRCSHQCHRRQKGPPQHRRAGFSDGGGHPVDQGDEYHHQTEEQQEPQPLPGPGQAQFLQTQQPGDELEKPLPGEDHHDGEVDGNEHQHGKDHAGHDLPDPLVAAPVIDVIHNVHQGPEGGRGGKQGGHDPRHQQAPGLIDADIGEIVGQDTQALPGQQFVRRLEHRPDIQMEQADKGVDTDQNGKKGQDQKIGQLSRRPGNPLAEVNVHDLMQKAHQRPVEHLLHTHTPFSSAPLHLSFPALGRDRTYCALFDGI